MNPEISSNSFSVNHVEQDQQQISSIINDNIDEIIDASNQTNQLSTNVSIDTIDEVDSDNENSIIAFTEKELSRAKSYQDRNWKLDGTINIAAWDYVLNNPNFNQDNDIDSNLDVVNVIK